MSIKPAQIRQDFSGDFAAHHHGYCQSGQQAVFEHQPAGAHAAHCSFAKSPQLFFLEAGEAQKLIAKNERDWGVPYSHWSRESIRLWQNSAIS